MFARISDTTLPARTPGTLEARLARRLAVEQHFAELGHSYRHGSLYRWFEHNVTRPVLRLGLQAIGMYGRGLRNALSPVVRRLSLQFENLPPALAGFEILHLSDFHIDENPALADALVPVLRELRPDLCVFTGDYRFEDCGPCEAIYPLMRKIVDAIEARYGIYGILGNHDAAEIVYALEASGVRMLVNEAVPVGPVEGRMWLAGVDDPFRPRAFLRGPLPEPLHLLGTHSIPPRKV